MRPGKPLMFGTIGPMRVLGLPGNPVSSLVCTRLFVVPLIRALMGQPVAEHWVQGRLQAPLPENDRREDYVRARIMRDADGGFVAAPFPRQDSSMMQVFSQSDGLVRRRPHAPAADAGETCDILLMRGPESLASA